jgi:arabinofuranosyltransferase
MQVPTARVRPSDTTQNASALVVSILIAEVAWATYAVVSRLPQWWADRWVQDDAYVSFRYARNFVHGNGLVYNVGERVEGYTNFLWTLLAAIPLAFGSEDPLPFMHAVSVVLWAVSYLLLVLIAVRLWKQGVWAAPLAVVALAHHWSFNMWFFSGMETPLVSLLVIATFFFFTRDPERHPLCLFLASLSGVLLTMTRPDGVVILAALMVCGTLLYWRRVLLDRRWRVYVFLPALPVFFLFLPYNAWRIAYYGSFFPNTYYTKVAYLPFYSRGWEYLSTYLSLFGLAGFLPCVAAALLVSGEPVRRTMLASLLIIGFVFFYVVRLGGDFMEWRFVTPVTSILYLAVVAGASWTTEDLVLSIRQRSRRESRPQTVERFGMPARGIACGSGIAIAMLLTYVTSAAAPNSDKSIMPGQETIGMLRRYGDPQVFDWRSAGKLFDEVLPQNIKIATTSAGIVPYFCDRPCLDLHGLTDPQIARSKVDPKERGRMGHEHWLGDNDLIRARGVDVLLYWVDPITYPKALVTPPDRNGQTVSVQIPDGRYVTFLVMNPDAVDMRELAKDPRVVLHGAKPVWKKDAFATLDELFAPYVVVDRLDVENGESQGRHQFQEISPPDQPDHWVYHTKFLPYRAPFEEAALEDEGRRILLGAVWKIENVLADRDLFMIGRYDLTGGAVYEVEVNGKRTSAELHAPGGEEAWSEAWVQIPAEYLIDGTNEIRITRISEPTDVEWYYFWFLQGPTADAEVAAQCR